MSIILTRYLEKSIDQDLNDKMVFLGGPRQVGKTTLALSLLDGQKLPAKSYYFNWDLKTARKAIKNLEWPSESKRISFDEIHKGRGWKNLIKGIYDTHKEEVQFLITGSARLNAFQKGGDSLLGRFYYYRLHPLSLPELGFNNLDQLFNFGGFPEPYLKADKRFHQRWTSGRLERLIKEDIRDLTRIRDLDKLETLAETLPERVGSALSINSLIEDLEVDFKTCKNWINSLASIYYCYLISPFGAPKIRAVKKEQKLYLWDWSQVEDKGARFENMLASHLLKFAHYRQDTEGLKTEVRYLRDHQKREIDFVYLENNKPLFAVEAKLKKSAVSKHLYYFEERTQIPKFYQVYLGEGSEVQHLKKNIVQMSFAEFCKQLSLV